MQTGKARANLGSHKNREERHWQDHAHDDQGKVCGHGHTPDDGKSCACADAAPAPDNGAEKSWPPISFARSARQRGSTLRRLCRAIVRSFLYMGRVRQAVQPAMNTVIGFGHSRRYQASAARI